MSHGGLNLWLPVFSNAASLTHLTPVFNNLPHTRPVTPLSDQFLNALHTSMTMQLLEHFSPVAFWQHQWHFLLSDYWYCRSYTEVPPSLQDGQNYKVPVRCCKDSVMLV